jgi:hypothetical protein
VEERLLDCKTPLVIGWGGIYYQCPEAGRWQPLKVGEYRPGERDWNSVQPKRVLSPQF